MENPPFWWYLPGKMGFSWAMLVSGRVDINAVPLPSCELFKISPALTFQGDDYSPAKPTLSLGYMGYLPKIGVVFTLQIIHFYRVFHGKKTHPSILGVKSPIFGSTPMWFLEGSGVWGAALLEPSTPQDPRTKSLPWQKVFWWNEQRWPREAKKRRRLECCGNCRICPRKFKWDTVDGWNLGPPGMYETL